MKSSKRSLRLGVILAFAVVSILPYGVARSNAQLASFEAIPLPPGVTEMKAMGISSDSTTVVGTLKMTDAVSQQVVRRPFKWRRSTGVELLEVPATPPGYAGPPIEGEAFACSGNGSVTVGWSTPAAGTNLRQAARWTHSTLVILAHSTAAFGRALDVSDDGSIIVGAQAGQWELLLEPQGDACWGFPLPPCSYAIAWDAGTQRLLGGGSVDGWAHAFGVSRDGSRATGVFGHSGLVPSHYFAGTWTYPYGTNRGTLAGSDVFSYVGSCLSDDGRIFGWFVDSSSSPPSCPAGGAVAWVPAGVNHVPVPRPHHQARAFDTSRTGSVVVGQVMFDRCGTTEAMRWEPGFSAQPIKETLIAREVPDISDWNLLSATGVSANGMLIVGFGTLGQDPILRAWIATLPTRCVADVDDGSGSGTPDGGVTIDDLLYFLARFEAGC